MDKIVFFMDYSFLASYFYKSANYSGVICEITSEDGNYNTMKRTENMFCSGLI